MKVNELIQKLQEFDPETLVVIENDYSDWSQGVKEIETKHRFNIDKISIPVVILKMTDESPTASSPDCWE
jgi:hypothetical protein